jgi:hypothetical protein
MEDEQLRAAHNVLRPETAGQYENANVLASGVREMVQAGATLDDVFQALGLAGEQVSGDEDAILAWLRAEDEMYSDDDEIDTPEGAEYSDEVRKARESGSAGFYGPGYVLYTLTYADGVYHLLVNDEDE